MVQNVLNTLFKYKYITKCDMTSMGVKQQQQQKTHSISQKGFVDCPFTFCISGVPQDLLEQNTNGV